MKASTGLLMAYSTNMPASARRHLIAADRLNAGARRDVAGYLYGIAAECAIKAMMIDAGYRPLIDRRNDLFFLHFPELRTALLNTPPRHNTCRRYRTKNLGAAKKDRSGTIRTNIQGPSGGAVVTARERGGGAGSPRGWHRRSNATALARRCAVQARPSPTFASHRLILRDLAL